MALKDILVRLGKDEAATSRADFASAIAAAHDGHLAGIATATWWIYGAVSMGPIPHEVVVSIQETAQEEAEEVVRIFAEQTQKTGRPAETRIIAGTVGEIVNGVVRNARHADLTILPQPKEDQGRSIVEALLFESGRPVLLVPYIGAPASHPGHALIAWDASAQSARAVHDAMPMLEKVDRVSVLTIDAQKRTNDHGAEPGADIATHLARHGLKVSVDNVIASDIDVGNAILSHAADINADLLVMGGYGHSRMRELVLGGATRTILASMTIPVIMSH